MIIATCLMLLLLSLASLPLAGRFLQPINKMIDGVERVRRGETDFRVESNRSDEFGELMDAFNLRSEEMGQMKNVITRQSDAHYALLHRMFPAFVAERLKKGDDRIVTSLHQASVIYVIIHNFSNETESLSGEDAIDLLNEIVNALDDAGAALGIEKVKTIGEHYLAVCGLSVARLDHARRAVDFCHAASQELALFNARHDLNLSLRVGIHSGPLHAGVIGDRNFVFDIWGTSLNIARRIVFDAGLNRLRISTHTYHMLNKKEDFSDEIVVDTKAVGKIVTYEQALDTAVDESRLAAVKGGAKPALKEGKEPVAQKETSQKAAE